MTARYTRPLACAHCGGTALRNKDRRLRRVRHDSWGTRKCVLELETRKYLCHNCGKHFSAAFSGILPRRRATEPFRRSVCQKHWDAISRSRLGRREDICSATVERWLQDYLRRQAAQYSGAACPTVLGIDEHFFTRPLAYATTFCDLRKHKVFDVVLGRSEAALDHYLAQLQGKQRVLVVCMDLASRYRTLVRKHFSNARIVADRFHVIRLINQHFLACWRQLDPVGAKNRGLISLMRRHRHKLSAEQQMRLQHSFALHPILNLIHRFKQRLCYLLLKKHRTRKQCEKLAPRLLRAVYQLRHAQLPQLMALGETLHSWSAEIATMWRFTRNNGITEAFHTKMEVLQRQAYRFRNFQNYRLRVRLMCC